MPQNDNENNKNGSDNNTSKRGFAAMKENDPDRQREIAAEGGRVAHATGRAHEFDSQSGRDAGRRSRGGQGGGQGGNNRDNSEDDNK